MTDFTAHHIISTFARAVEVLGTATRPATVLRGKVIREAERGVWVRTSGRSFAPEHFVTETDLRSGTYVAATPDGVAMTFPARDGRTPSTNIYDRDASQLMIVLGQLKIAGYGTDDVLLFRYENDAPDATRPVSYRNLRELDRYIATCRHARTHRDTCPNCDAATDTIVSAIAGTGVKVTERLGDHTHRLGMIAVLGDTWAAMTDDRDLIGTGIVSADSAVRALRLDHKRRSHQLALRHVPAAAFIPGNPFRRADLERTVDTAAMMVLADDPDVRRALRTLNAAGITTGTMFEAALRLKAEQDARLAPALAQRPNMMDLDVARTMSLKPEEIVSGPTSLVTHALGRSDMLRPQPTTFRTTNYFVQEAAALRELLTEVHTAACHLSDTHDLCFRIPSRHHDETRMPCVVRQEKAVRLWTKRNRARREYPEIYATSGLYPDSVADLIAAIDPDPSAL